MAKQILFITHKWGAGDLNSDYQLPKLAVCQVSVAPRNKKMHLIYTAGILLLVHNIITSAMLCQAYRHREEGGKRHSAH